VFTKLAYKVAAVKHQHYSEYSRLLLHLNSIVSLTSRYP